MNKPTLPPQINHYHGPFALKEILAVAKIHPFYSDKRISSPDYNEVAQAARGCLGNNASLQEMPITRKERLAAVTSRLSKNIAEARSFRSGAVIGITGGGSGKGAPMPFFTDAQETVAIRSGAGKLLVKCGVVGDGDVAVVLNTSGNLYRSLSIISDCLEHAGVSTLMAGHTMDPDRLINTCQQLQPNVLAGAPTQLIQFARHVAKTGVDLKFQKIVYTSEPLPLPQHAYLNHVFGVTDRPISFGSIYGSAEAGPWAVANHDLSYHHESYVDLIYDKNTMVVEIIPVGSTKTEQSTGSTSVANVPHGRIGIIVLTSLQKLRHPLVRYYTGDLGSLHELTAEMHSYIGEGASDLGVLRMYGRDRTESFKWQGNFYELRSIEEAMRTPDWGVLDWQISLQIDPDYSEHVMDIKLIRPDPSPTILSASALRKELCGFFNVYFKVDHLFKVQSVGLQDMVRSQTAGKIIRLIDETQST